MKFAIFRRKFDENLPEFQKNVQEMINCRDILRKSARKIRKMLEISGMKFCEKFSFFISFFHSSPYLLPSVVAAYTCSECKENSAIFGVYFQRMGLDGDHEGPSSATPPRHVDHRM
jgi:hypothetical protein